MKEAAPQEALPELDSRSLAWIDESVREVRINYDLGEDMDSYTLCAAVDRAQARIEQDRAAQGNE